jgi:hypothetical protein
VNKSISRATGALSLLDEAIEVAEAANSPTLANLARSYRATRLVSEYRIAEATAELDELWPRLDQRELDYARAIAYSTTATSLLVDDPERAYQTALIVHRHYEQYGLDKVTESLTHDLLPTATAATGRASETRRLVNSAWDSYQQAGSYDGVLELLLPCAVVAWRRGELELSRRWMRAIRSAPTRPRSLIISMYRQFRDVIGLDERNPLDTATLHDIFAEASRWLDAEARRELAGET